MNVDKNSHRLILTTIILFLLASCTGIDNKSKDQDEQYPEGTFGYDATFLGKYYEDLIVLQSEDKNSLIAVVPSLQGRIMTSSANGMSGKSFGWINYDLIASNEKLEHMNPFGGEERFWIGPEGGQFSYYFKPNSTFDGDNWFVPKEIDTEPFNLISSDLNSAKFEKSMNLVNYSGNQFSIKVNRDLSLLSNDRIQTLLGIALPEEVNCIGFESINMLTNTGTNAWDKSYGMPSIWILSMLNPSEKGVIILPFKSGEISELGPIVNDTYFGKIAQDRISLSDNAVFFKGDGQQRGKIGIPPKRALPMAGSYDAVSGVLTIAQFTIPEGASDYVNSMWEMQEHPFSGDVVNAYNDGPFNGTIMGPFYEIESSSPAANLSSDESLTHIHRTFHFMGTIEDLNGISKRLLGVDLNEVTEVF